ncbi:group 1 truncated hemoglobin [Galbitalea soli]|uniref:Group 1 truncated hemoglobin n=1 Tax=Galbitalea soli TaxID=1268042 RepID=A0A7C9PKB7_9MICO|nr:group 1 truncated hemoglobin [Galbitalea soli]NYJ30475.1 hemoglobin [Galbitalea soli]
MTLVDADGGADAVAVAVDAFYTRLMDDPALAARFEGVDLRKLIGHQRAFVVAALGGADLYLGRDMRSAHAGLQLTDAEFDSAVRHLSDSLAEAGFAGSLIAVLAARLEPLRAQIVGA